MTNSLLIRNVHPFEKNSKTKEMTNLLIGADGLIKKINPIIDTPENCKEKITIFI